MPIQLDLKIWTGYGCHRVANTKFAVGDQKFIEYPINAMMVPDSQPMAPMTTNLINFTQGIG